MPKRGKSIDRRIDRRCFVSTAIGLVAAGAVLPRVLGSNLLCNMETPRQTEGPFYPVGSYDDTNWDLTWVTGRGDRANGEIIMVEGIVKDTNCRPIENAVVEIWQACASGRYNHPSDESNNALDPNFQGWGIVSTDRNGHYFFQTVIPGQYHVTETWIRPPHIHFKVNKPGFNELITQLYFEGHPLNKNDHILNRVEGRERKRVVHPLSKIERTQSGIDEINPSVIAEKRVVFDMVI